MALVCVAGIIGTELSPAALASDPEKSTSARIGKLQPRRIAPDVARAVDPGQATVASSSKARMHCYQHGRRVYEATLSAHASSHAESKPVVLANGRRVDVLSVGNVACFLERPGARRGRARASGN